jgi:hypothetical protein
MQLLGWHMRSEHKPAARATSAARSATRAERDAIAVERDAAAAAARDASDALWAARRRVDALVAMAARDKAAWAVLVGAPPVPAIRNPNNGQL